MSKMHFLYLRYLIYITLSNYSLNKAPVDSENDRNRLFMVSLKPCKVQSNSIIRFKFKDKLVGCIKMVLHAMRWLNFFLGQFLYIFEVVSVLYFYLVHKTILEMLVVSSFYITFFYWNLSISSFHFSHSTLQLVFRILIRLNISSGSRMHSSVML